MDVFIFVLFLVSFVVVGMTFILASVSFVATARRNREYSRSFFERYVETGISFFWFVVFYPLSSRMGRLIRTAVRDAIVPKNSEWWYESVLDARIDEWRAVCSIADTVTLAHTELVRQFKYIRRHGDRKYERVCEKIMTSYTNGWAE